MNVWNMRSLNLCESEIGSFVGRSWHNCFYFYQEDIAAVRSYLSRNWIEKDDNCYNSILFIYLFFCISYFFGGRDFPVMFMNLNNIINHDIERLQLNDVESFYLSWQGSFTIINFWSIAVTYSWYLQSRHYWIDLWPMPDW